MTAALPDGTRLLHIGPHKTGTTTIQAAFHQNRERLAAQGVDYVSRNKHPMGAAMAAAQGISVATSSVDAGMRSWRALAGRMRDSEARISVVSSEFFSEATPERIRQILDELGAEQTHVVITLRPLIRILASQWQQYMQNRPSLKYDDTLDYEGWLDEVLNRPEERRVTPSFWHRHAHDELVARWVEVVGTDRISVVVVDERDKRMLLRSFEELVGVSEGSLEPREIGANRSLTLPEITLLRAVNSRYLAAEWSRADYTRLLRFGAIRHLQERAAGAEEPRLLTPSWAIDRAVEHSRAMVARIRSTGVPVIGDLDLLADPSLATGVGDNPDQVRVPVEIAARLAAGLVRMVHEIPAELSPDRRVGEIEAMVSGYRAARVAPDRDVDALSSAALLRIVAGRVRNRIRNRIRGRLRRGL